jgi:hypothetical protein
MPSPTNYLLFFLATSIVVLLIGVCAGIAAGIWIYRRWFERKDEPFPYDRWRQVADDRGRLVPNLPAYQLQLGVKLEELFRDLDLHWNNW